MAKKRRTASPAGGTSRSATLPPATEKDVRVRVFGGHTAIVYRVAMPADGRFALTSSEDGTVRRWPLTEDGTQAETVCQATSGFRGLAVTADGNLAAAGDTTGIIHLIAPSAARELRAWKGNSRSIGNLAFLHEGRELVSAAAFMIRRWNSDTGDCIAECRVSIKDLYGVAASADGSQIVGAGIGQGLSIWSGRDGEEPRNLEQNVAYSAPVSLANGNRFAFTGTHDGGVAKWDLDARRRVAVFEGHSGNVHAVAVTLDGRFCVSGGEDQTVRLWAAESGQCLAILRGHTGWVFGVAITPDARRIASVGRDDKAMRVWDIPDSVLARAATSQKRGYQNAKVVLLGESRVGKTGLANRLWHDAWHVTDSTHGMEIRRLALSDNDNADIEQEVWLWDLAGQPEYRLTHQLFIEQTSLAAVVIDRQREDWEDSAKYWHQALKKIAKAQHVPCILVAGRCDEPGQRVTEDELRSFASKHGFLGPVLTAAKQKKHPGAGQLRQLIKEALPWDQLEFRSTMENFPPLKDAILKVRESQGCGQSVEPSGEVAITSSRNRQISDGHATASEISRFRLQVIVTPDELEARVREVAPKLKFTSDDLRAVTGLLAGEGVLHALPYGGLIVLQPRWLNAYASTLVKLAGEAENKLGHVAMSLIQPGKLPENGTPRLSLEDERQLLPALVALFLERALAWKQDTPEGPMLVFPNYVRLPRPAPPPRPGQTVVYRFIGPLEEIYCTLVVRLHYSGLFKKDGTQLYRQAADFQTASGKLAALTMTTNGERGELEIYFGDQLDSDIQAAFQQFVDDHLRAKSQDLTRLRNYFCPKCKEEVTDRAAIDAAQAAGRKKLVCNRCDPDRKGGPGVIDLFDVLERQLATKAGEARADEAEKQANEAISTASMEQVMIGAVMELLGEAGQIYRIQAEPDEGVDGEIEFRNNRKKATGLTYRVQLKSGDSHLKRRKDGSEVFAMKKHYESYWAAEGTVPVLLIIRTSDGRLRFMNATKAIRAAKAQNTDKAVKQIEFVGEDFTKEAVLKLRDQRLREAAAKSK